MISGVPRCSIVGPLLFLVYINHISDGLIHLSLHSCSIFIQYLNTLHSLVCNNLTSQTKVFADDCAIFCQVSNAADCDVLQEDLATVYTWAQRWQLPLNLSKCKVICISNKRKPCPHIYLPCEQCNVAMGGFL